MKIETLTEDNFLMFAMKHYDNPSCLDVKEFNNDLKKVKYIKRLIQKFKSLGVSKERVILNNIIILCNIFGVEATTKILFFKIEREHWPELKTFLEFLKCMPDRISGLSGGDIISSDIPLNMDIVSSLRKL